MSGELGMLMFMALAKKANALTTLAGSPPYSRSLSPLTALIAIFKVFARADIMRLGQTGNRLLHHLYQPFCLFLVLHG